MAQKRYRGPLTPAQIAEGSNIAIRNARRLVSDARLLIKAGSLPSAAALAILSVEEAHKPSILRGIAVAQDDDLRNHWKKYRNHRAKNGTILLPDLALKGARTLADLALLLDPTAKHTEEYDLLKQAGFYTDCYGEQAEWHEPAGVHNEQSTEALVRIAELLTPSRDVTVREIELWVLHLGPVWNTLGMLNGLIAWQAAMYAEGLSTFTAEHMKAFAAGDGINVRNPPPGFSRSPIPAQP